MLLSIDLEDCPLPNSLSMVNIGPMETAGVRTLPELPPSSCEISIERFRFGMKTNYLFGVMFTVCEHIFTNFMVHAGLAEFG